MDSHHRHNAGHTDSHDRPVFDPWRAAAHQEVHARHGLPAVPAGDLLTEDPSYVPQDQYVLDQHEAAGWLCEYLVLSDDLDTHDQALDCLHGYEDCLTDLTKLAGAIQLGASLMRLARDRIAEQTTLSPSLATPDVSCWLSSLVTARARAAAACPDLHREVVFAGRPDDLWRAFTDLLRFSFDNHAMTMRAVGNEAILRLNAMFVAVATDDDVALRHLVDETLLMEDVARVALLCLTRLAWGACHLFTTSTDILEQTVARVRADTGEYLDIPATLRQNVPRIDTDAFFA